MEKNSVKRAGYKLIDFVRKNKLETALLVVILVVGCFLRLYKIDQYMTFLGDEGRDVIVVRRLLVYFDPILIGPGTSIGNMYLGPLYYYLIAPALWLAGYSPVGPAVMVAILGVVTIGFVWWIGREWFPSIKSGQVAWGALIAAGLYALSPTVIVYSRSSWNPNIMPFFAILCVYSIWRVWNKHQFRWLIVLGISYAFVLQSHYLGLLLGPTLFLFWILTLRDLKLIRNSKFEIINFLQKSLFAFLIFAGLMSPLVIFDARHGWRNYSAMRTFFTVRQETVSIRPWNAIPKIYPIFEKVNTRLIAGKNIFVGKAVSLALAIFLIWLLVKRRSLFTSYYSLVTLWLLVSIIGLGLYKQEIYDHYYGFFFAAPFLLLGGLVGRIAYSEKRIAKITLFIILGSLFIINLCNSPIRYPPNQQLRRAKEVAEKISGESGGKRFNLAVIAERNYEDGYQYFLEMWKKPVVDIDAQIPDTITNQLFVVCEMVKEKCDPTHSPKAEVANFGWSKIESEWTVFGTTLYKLVHSE